MRYLHISDMDQWGDVLLSLLCLSSLCGLSCGVEHDGCRNHSLQFKQVVSVPGEVAMLSSTLLSPNVFNLSAEPYNVTWYRLHSEQPISNQSGRVLVVQESLWFLNVTVADAGDYVTVVRTPQQCFRQETKLVVDPLSQCGRPRMPRQRLHKGVNGRLSCPLSNYLKKLRSYNVSSNITWYKGCEQISDGTHRFHYSFTFLKVERVESADQGPYTCTLRFSLGGVRGGVSETINATVKEAYCELPQIREPANDTVKAELGSNVTKRCQVFVPCVGGLDPEVDVHWQVQNDIIPSNPKERIYTPRKRTEWQDRGLLIDRWLVISELKEQDLSLNFTCRVTSGYGSFAGYFTLLQKEPELLIPVSLGLGSCLLLFLIAVSVYHVFKLELVLWFRGTFPTLYSSSASDGKLYDAYVAYPQRCAMDWTQEVERFALHTLPQVLEEACGYSLFIPDRDSLPGEAVLDSVEENLKVSRSIILLYTASTFSKRKCSNNNMLLSDITYRTETGDLSTSEDRTNTSEEHLKSNKEDLKSNKEHVNSSEDHLNLKKELLKSNKEPGNSNKDHLNSSDEHLNSNKEDLNSNKDHLNLNKELLNSNKEDLNSKKEHFNSNKDRLNSTKEHIISNNDHPNTSMDNPRPCEDLKSACHCEFLPQSHARTHLECVIAMHRALLERSLKVILVELEELGPSEVEQLPESVRHLRQTQGAVCWWRTRGTWMTRCIRRTGDTETALSSCVSPDCRFWKEVRYRMPVKGKRSVPPEATTLLQL